MLLVGVLLCACIICTDQPICVHCTVLYCRTIYSHSIYTFNEISLNLGSNIGVIFHQVHIGWIKQTFACVLFWWGRGGNGEGGARLYFGYGMYVSGDATIPVQGGAGLSRGQSCHTPINTTDTN